MLQAITTALVDTTLSEKSINNLRVQIDSLDIVRTWTWPYADLPSLISARLGASPRHVHYTEHGGNQPAKLVDDAARRISLGQAKVAVVVGGEALASCI